MKTTMKQLMLGMASVAVMSGAVFALDDDEVDTFNAMSDGAQAGADALTDQSVPDEANPFLVLKNVPDALQENASGPIEDGWASDPAGVPGIDDVQAALINHSKNLDDALATLITDGLVAGGAALGAQDPPGAITAMSEAVPAALGQLGVLDGDSNPPSDEASVTAFLTGERGTVDPQSTGSNMGSPIPITLTGTVNAAPTSGCSFNGGQPAGTTIDFGTVDNTEKAGAKWVSEAQATGIQVDCTTAQTVTLSTEAGDPALSTTDGAVKAAVGADADVKANLFSATSKVNTGGTALGTTSTPIAAAANATFFLYAELDKSTIAQADQDAGGTIGGGGNLFFWIE